MKERVEDAKVSILLLNIMGIIHNVEKKIRNLELVLIPIYNACL